MGGSNHRGYCLHYPPWIADLESVLKAHVNLNVAISVTEMRFHLNCSDGANPIASGRIEKSDPMRP